MRNVTCDTFGTFDAVASLGAFEHFCSPEDYRAGRQEDIYRSLFENVAGMLAPAGSVLPADHGLRSEHDRCRPDRRQRAARHRRLVSGAALLGCQFPGSFLPFGQEQIVRCAVPGFRLVASTSGRLDYIETINQWERRIGAHGLRKSLFKFLLVPLRLTSREFRLGFASGVCANQVCFQRELLDHHRLVFERV